MAKRKEVDEQSKELKGFVQGKKVVYGTDQVMKGLKAKSLVKVYVASNTRQDVREDIAHYANLAGIPVVELGFDNEELGVFCKKNFFVSVLGVIGA